MRPILSGLGVSITAWFEATHRDMPWREDATPYKVMVSEYMLQQTQVVTVIPYFEKFIKRFPDIQELAAADVDEVLLYWQGLGYYTRAHNLHRAARIITAQYQGQIPGSYEAIQTLPGMGRYTAAALSSIAFGKAVPSVDGNVLRVLARYMGIYEPVNADRTKKRVFDLLTPAIQEVSPSSFNQGLMELGALICKPSNPDCKQCPLAHACYAFLNGKIPALPVKKAPKAHVPFAEVAVGLIFHKRKVLIAKRHEGRMLGGLWEFPGGKREPGESVEEALHREIQEEIGINIRMIRLVGVVNHTYSHLRVQLYAFECSSASAKIEALDHAKVAWIDPANISRYAMARGSQKVWKIFLGMT